MRCYRQMLNVSYRDHVINEEIRRMITDAIGPHYQLLTVVRKRKLRWYGHISRTSGLAKTILHGTVPETRKRGRQKKRREHNIKEWTGLYTDTCLRVAENRKEWKEIVAQASLVPQRPNGLKD